MTEAEIAAVAGRLSEAQKRLVLESGPDDLTGEEGCGVEIRGTQYRVARKLQALGLGSYSHGSPFYDMYYNFDRGLAVRAHLQGQATTPNDSPAKGGDE